MSCSGQMDLSRCQVEHTPMEQSVQQLNVLALVIAAPFSATSWHEGRAIVI